MQTNPHSHANTRSKALENLDRYSKGVMNKAHGVDFAEPHLLPANNYNTLIMIQ